MAKKIGFVSLGCPKNQVDTEVMLGLTTKNGYIVTDEKQDAQILVVNTCGFIESAKEESINTILELSQCKKDKCEVLIVTGCLAQRYSKEIIEQIPEVDAVVGSGNYQNIVNIIKDTYEQKGKEYLGDINNNNFVDVDRVLSTNKGVAYLKIAEGCDNHCTYCVIPSLRGKYRSRTIESILKEAKNLASNGVKEIILIAQDTTRYGIDIYGEKSLVKLIKEISKIEDIIWIRLLYCYPEEITEELINEFAQNPKLLKYIDVPVQHISDRILKLMGRRGTSKEIKKILNALRKSVPQMIIRTSLIVGFPGETEEDFNLLINFVGKIKFDRLGVFAYSKEEGTPASKMKGQITKKDKLKRQNMIMTIQQEISQKKSNKRLGEICECIVEGVADDGIFYFGRSYQEAPEIDGLIYFTSADELQMSQFVKVKILNIDDYDLIGEVFDESAK